MLNKIREQGFLLFEMLAAMAVSTIILVTAARFFPALGQDVLNTYRQYKLDTIMRETLLRLEKDLRRTASAGGIVRAIRCRLRRSRARPGAAAL